MENKNILLMIAASSLLISAVIFSVSQEKKLTGDLSSSQIDVDQYCPWLYRAGTPRGYTYYGWLINGTLMTIESIQIDRLFNLDCGNKIPAYSLWDAIPKHNLKMNDPSMMFVRIQHASNTLQSDVFLIMNGTKWPLLGGMNQTISSGVKEQMVAFASIAYLQSIPTGMYLPTPY